jgi:hypothetical protein
MRDTRTLTWNWSQEHPAPTDGQDPPSDTAIYPAWGDLAAQGAKPPATQLYTLVGELIDAIGEPDLISSASVSEEYGNYNLHHTLTLTIEEEHVVYALNWMIDHLPQGAELIPWTPTFGSEASLFPPVTSSVEGTQQVVLSVPVSRKNDQDMDSAYIGGVIAGIAILLDDAPFNTGEITASVSRPRTDVTDVDASTARFSFSARTPDGSNIDPEQVRDLQLIVNSRIDLIRPELNIDVSAVEVEVSAS